MNYMLTTALMISLVCQVIHKAAKILPHSMHKESSTYILRALLVSGLSPRTWRICTSEAQPSERKVRMASARRRMGIEPGRFRLSASQWASSRFFLKLWTPRLWALEPSLELLVIPEAAFVDSNSDEDIDTVLQFMLDFQSSELLMIFERALRATCEQVTIHLKSHSLIRAICQQVTK